jgi:hypothetical protein
MRVYFHLFDNHFSISYIMRLLIIIISRKNREAAMTILLLAMTIPMALTMIMLFPFRNASKHPMMRNSTSREIILFLSLPIRPMILL